MPINVIFHDTRLEGRTPVSTSSTRSFEVDGDTPTSEFFEHVISLSNENNGIGTLYIMAHGVRVLDLHTSAIKFTHDFISYQNVHLFQQLREKVERIVLFVCHASETDLTTHGDGDELCRQMARNAQAEVTAARENQAYLSVESCGLFSCEEAAIDFGEWEGPVVVYDRNGVIIAQYNNPSSWRDTEGVMHDPRVDPNPYRDGEGSHHTSMGR